MINFQSKLKLGVVALVSLGACSSLSIPASGVTSDGKGWTGYFTLDEFTLSDGSVICTGETPTGTAKVQRATFTCDDGRTGTAQTTRTGMAGGIVDVDFSDGTTGKFQYGT
ncbi:hypothetical protein [Pseudophaeobacter profundi]|uniref:hypothetical protein n=1 Tax=Pseudophaeobacter profundi TaxID=3034152 RepID=UPI002431AAA2|nr:hypothetical protein [Pseudophaeobacter profundi]